MGAPLERLSTPPMPLDGPPFEQAQRALALFNRERLTPVYNEQEGWRARKAVHEAIEDAFVCSARNHIRNLISDVPTNAIEFVNWFESLREKGPGQGDPLFPWLAETATHAQMRWFLAQEVAGEAGFEDLLSLTQVKMPTTAKLEMARNYWDEMGRGARKGMHGPMLQTLAETFGLDPTPDSTVPEALALGNLMVAMAANRHLAFQSIGALGAIELTAPTRAVYVRAGLARLGISEKASHYFALHAVLDVKHSNAWNKEVLVSLVAEDPNRAKPIAEGAILRLWCGARCFDRYRRHLFA